jgi:hypothetical protein
MFLFLNHIIIRFIINVSHLFLKKGACLLNHLITNGLGKFRKYFFLLLGYHSEAKNAATEQIEFIDRLHSFLKLYRMASAARWRIFSTNRKKESTFRPALIHVTTFCMAYILEQQCHMDLVIKFKSATMTSASCCNIINIAFKNMVSNFAPFGNWSIADSFRFLIDMFSHVKPKTFWSTICP